MRSRPSRLRVAATVGLGLGAGLACQQAEPAPSFAEADSIVGEWVRSGRIPGAVLLVARDGETLLHEAYGSAQAYTFGAGQYEDHGGIEALVPPRPMSPETVFDLASVTKVMATTMAMMLLVDRGGLELDTPVATFLPDFTGGGKDAITVRHLLTHTSGLEQWVPTYYHADTPSGAYEYIRDLPLGWPVGEGRHYSDLGFMLLGRIVEAVSGRPLDVYLQEELYGPLGLVETGFRPVEDNAAGKGVPSTATATFAAAAIFAATSHGNPFERRMVHDPGFGYEISGDPDTWDGWRHRTLQGEVNDGNAFHAFGGIAGHAGLFSTAAELAVLLDLMQNEGELAGRRYLQASTVREFLTPQVEGQALGWQLPDFASPGGFGHTGFTGTFVLGLPADGISLVLLTNRQNVGVDAETRYPDIAPLQRAVAESLTKRPAS